MPAYRRNQMGEDNHVNDRATFSQSPSVSAKILGELRCSLRDLWINGLLSSGVVPSKLRVAALRLAGYRMLGAKVACKCYIGAGQVVLGSRTFLNLQCYLEPSAGIYIGSGVMIGPRTSIITTTHPIGSSESSRTDRSPSSMTRAPVRVGDNVWIGLGTTILPGVTIGNGAVIAAGSVVTTDVMPNTLVGGVPARLIRSLPV